MPMEERRADDARGARGHVDHPRMNSDEIRTGCAGCGEEIRTDLEECPICGNNPSKVVRRASIIVALAGLVFGLLFPPVSVFAPLGLIAFLAGRFVELSPTEHYYPIAWS